MNRQELEDYMVVCSEEQYDTLLKERIARLNSQQQAVAIAREEQRKIRAKLIDKLDSSDPDVHQMVFDTLRDMDGSECEHGRHYVKFCDACVQMDHIMFPEFWDEDGNSTE